MEKWRRKNYFIEKNFQTRFIMRFCAIVITSSLLIIWLLFILSVNFTTVAIENAHVIVKRTSDFMLPIVIQTVMVVTAFSAFAVIALTLFTSHKIAGPVYRLKIEIEKFKNGNLSANFKTRSSDQLQDLALSLSDMGQVIGKQHLEIRSKFEQLQKCLGSPNPDKNAIIKYLDELEQSISYFKI